MSDEFTKQDWQVIYNLYQQGRGRLDPAEMGALERSISLVNRLGWANDLPGSKEKRARDPEEGWMTVGDDGVPRPGAPRIRSRAEVEFDTMRRVMTPPAESPTRVWR